MNPETGTALITMSHASGNSLKVVPTNVSRTFLNQQLKIFAKSESQTERQNRIFRYFAGQKSHNRPAKSFGTVLNPNPGELPNPSQIEFGQPSVASVMSRNGKLGIKTEIIDGEKEGRAIIDIVADLKSGRLTSMTFLSLYSSIKTKGVKSIG